MNLKDLASSPQAIKLGMAASLCIPAKISHRLFWWVADLVSRFDPAVYRVVKSNLRHVLEPGVTRQTLEQTARQVLYTTLRGYYDLFRALRWPREEIKTLVEIPEDSQSVLRSMWNRKGGSLLVFAHLGNFDLGGQALAPYLPETQLLTLPDPPPGFQFTNEIRKRAGVQVTPLSSSALRDAIRLLQRGGTVSLAVDRPVSDLDEPVPFFGLPARVPSGHIRLALKTGAVVVVACCVLSPGEKRYIVHLEPPLEMIRTGNREEELRLNMRRVLDVLEANIRRWPEQWQMFVPLWPEPAAA
jgi:lauroyl/myristoyl acyltransferase